MASPNLDITHILAGQNAKEVTINSAIDALDNAMNSLIEHIDTADFSVTDEEFRENSVHLLSGGPSAQITMSVPQSISRIFIVINNSGQAVTIQVSGGTGAAVDLEDGTGGIFHSDGTDVRSAASGSGSGGGGGANSLYFASLGAIYESIADWDTEITSNSAYALKGNTYDVLESCGIYKVRAQFGADAGQTIVCEIYRVDSGDVIQEILGTSNTVDASAQGVYEFDFSEAVSVSDGDTISVVFLRTDGTGTTANELSYANATGNAKTEPFFSYVRGLRETIVNPVVSDDITGNSTSTEWGMEIRAFSTLVGVRNDDLAAYDIAVSFTGTPVVSDLIFRTILARPIKFKDDFADSVGIVGTNPTSSVVLDVEVDGTKIGDITINSSGNYTFSTDGSGDEAVSAGSYIDIVCSTADSTVEDITFTLAGIIS